MTAVNPVHQIDQTFFYIIGISLVLLLLITTTMIYFVVRYRRDKHPHPANIRGNWILEVIWTIVPTLIALSMFYFGWTSYVGLKNVPPGALEIEVIGEMYAWIFVYPDGRETENQLIVPQGRAVKLNVTSNDVLHSLFISAFRLKVDAVGGMHSYSWFLAEKLGEYDIQCTEFCGSGHADMRGILKVVPEQEYLNWLATEPEENDFEDEEPEDDEKGEE